MKRDPNFIILAVLLVCIGVVIVIQSWPSSPPAPVVKQNPKPNVFDQFDGPRVAPVWTPPASDRIVQPVHLQLGNNTVADQLSRANDIAERRLRDEEFGLLNNDSDLQKDDSWQDFYQFQQNNLLERQTLDLDTITELYQNQYYRSLYQSTNAP